MKLAQLIHNPSAGEEGHDYKLLIQDIEVQGYRCRYTSTKKSGWDEIEDDVDLIIIAGGDGTVKKVITEVLKRKSTDKDLPIALLPYGTANNIAKSLGLKSKSKTVIKDLGKSAIKPIDIGRIYNLKDADFFIESFGFGIFPYLMQKMKKREESYNSPEEELKGALKTLHEVILDYDARDCKLEIDDTDHSGKFILAEVMNTKSIGPNLVLAPFSDPGDGEFEIVLVPEKHKQKFADYINCLINDQEDTFQFYTMQAKKVNISWQGTHAHVDDEIAKLEENEEICLEIKPGALHFMVPPGK